MTEEKKAEMKARFFAQYWGQRVGFVVNDMGDWEVGKCKFIDYLELTPLSQITDEDAIEVAKIAGNSSYMDDRRAFNGRLLMQEFLRKQSNVYGESWLHVFDYLRSKGYALPYMGILVEEMVKYGWIKLKE
jgi:hypothetical protein